MSSLRDLGILRTGNPDLKVGATDIWSLRDLRDPITIGGTFIGIPKEGPHN